MFRQAAPLAINYVCGFLPEGRDWPFVSPEVDRASETVKMTARCPAVARRLGKVLLIGGQCVSLFFTCSGQADNDVVVTATTAVANELKRRRNGDNLLLLLGEFVFLLCFLNVFKYFFFSSFTLSRAGLSNSSSLLCPLFSLIYVVFIGGNGVGKT